MTLCGSLEQVGVLRLGGWKEIGLVERQEPPGIHCAWRIGFATRKH